MGANDERTALVRTVRAELVADSEGELHAGIPQPDDAHARFALAVTTVDGTTVTSDDADLEVTIQSVVKPWIYAAALRHDAGAVHDRIGVEPTGEPFDALVVEAETGRPPNPMVNAGALVASSLVEGDDPLAQAQGVVELVSAAAGRELAADGDAAGTEIAAAHRNRALGHLVKGGGALTGDVDAAVEVLARCCSIRVTVRDLAAMAATLAGGGRHPTTGHQVLPTTVVTEVLSVMATCGMYDGSGRWAHRVGMPAKSGISGTLVGVSTGRMGLAAISPPLDPTGNSVRGVKAMTTLSEAWGLHPFGFDDRKGDR